MREALVSRSAGSSHTSGFGRWQGWGMRLSEPVSSGRSIGALSRLAGAVFCGVACAAPAAASPREPLTAEKAVETQREGLRRVVAPRCGRGAGEEIVVCGRRDAERDRLPLRGERIAGARSGLLPGEAPTGAGALRATRESCSNVGAAPRCGFSVNFIRVGIVAFKVARHLIDPDSDPPPPPLASDPYRSGD